MRPLISLHNAVGVVMLFYALAVMVTPRGGAMGFIVDNSPLTPPMVAALFAGCGTYILIGNPKPARFALLTTPILLYSVASLGFLLSPAGGALTAYFAHTGLWLVINAALYERARKSWT